MTTVQKSAALAVIVMAFAFAPLPSHAATASALETETLALELRIMELKIKLAHLAGNAPASSSTKPSCILVASDNYPGDPGKRVRLQWVSENADRAKITYKTGNENRVRNMRGEFNANGYKTIGADQTTTYFVTVRGGRESATCETTVNYKG